MIVIPALVWRSVIEGFTATPGSVERIAFLDGVAAAADPADGGVVTTATFPNASESAGHWHVATPDMSDAGRHLRTFGLVRLAQVHSHPGTWIGHSLTDDKMAFSQAPGTVSIVLPAHALTYPGLGDAGVHIRERWSWRELEHEEVPDYVRVVPSNIDHRRQR